MSMNFLQNISPNELENHPFPHVVKDGVLPEKLRKNLADSYPDLASIDPRATQNSFRFLYGMKQVQNDDRISESWKETLAYLSSPESFHEITDVLMPELLKQFPHRFKNEEQVKQLRIGIRGIDSYLDKDVLLDAQVRGNTGDSGPSCVQGPHIDSDYKIYSGLLYLKTKNDDTIGGNLEARELAPESLQNLSNNEIAKRFFSEGPYIDPSFTKINKIIPYSENTLFLFMNSLKSIHSVSERQATIHTRKFIGFTAEMRTPLFHSKPTLQNKILLIKRDISHCIQVAKVKVIIQLAKITVLKKLYHLVKSDSA
jgi:hypothetical protein